MRVDFKTLKSIVLTVFTLFTSYSTIFAMHAHNTIKPLDTTVSNMSLSSLSIPDDVTGISSFALSENLTSITIPHGIKMIGKRAFWRCKNLANIVYKKDSYNNIDEFLKAFKANGGIVGDLM